MYLPFVMGECPVCGIASECHLAYSLVGGCIGKYRHGLAAVECQFSRLETPVVCRRFEIVLEREGECEVYGETYAMVAAVAVVGEDAAQPVGETAV